MQIRSMYRANRIGQREKNCRPITHPHNHYTGPSSLSSTAAHDMTLKQDRSACSFRALYIFWLSFFIFFACQYTYLSSVCNTSLMDATTWSSHAPPVDYSKRREELGDHRDEAQALEAARQISFRDVFDDPNSTPPRGQANMQTAYQKSTTVERASWFQSQKICKDTCCAYSIAQSMDSDARHLITTIDGPDLSDVAVLGHYNAQRELDWGHSEINQDILPCLQPNVIVYADSMGKGVGRFFESYRPNITVPYVLLSGEADGNSPMDRFRDRMDTDDLMLAFYGINPSYFLSRRHEKYRMLHLGLARHFPQQPDLLALQEARRFQNPFVGAAKKKWTESKLLQDTVEDTSQILFVKFGLRKPWRWDAFYMGCPYYGGNTTHPANARPASFPEPLSCTTTPVSPRQTYFAASHYLFGLSPPGHGYDCYRTYELLLLGIIPIIEAKEEANELFEGLPVIQVNEWNMEPAKLVQIMKDYVASKEFRESNFDGWERMFLSYNRRRVLKDAKREILEDPEGNQYYKKWRYTSYRRESEDFVLI